MKAGVPEAELQALGDEFQYEICALDVPGEAGQRHAVVLYPA